MKVLSVQDHSMAMFKPPMLALFTNVGTESPWGITWQVDAVFSPIRTARGCPHLHQGHGRRAGERDDSECVRDATGTDACGVAPAGGSGMP